MKILIADDDLVARKILVDHLTQAGHDVHPVDDGQAAWDLWQREHIPLVIADWTLPAMEGPELARQIRGGGIENYTYIILLTSLDAKSDLAAGRESGADDYLTKPFDAAELRARVAIGERILNLETRLKESLAQQNFLATHDGLTALFNRRHFMELAEREVERSRRTSRPLSAILLDIDRFKKLNDTYGHAVGDHVLRAVAEVCQNSLREVDILGRHGGEEFAVILPETDLPAAREVAERVRQAVEAARAQTDSGDLAFTISVGIAGTKDAFPDLRGLLDQADAALHAAKQAGRNRVEAAQ